MKKLGQAHDLRYDFLAAFEVFERHFLSFTHALQPLLILLPGYCAVDGRAVCLVSHHSRRELFRHVVRQHGPDGTQQGSSYQFFVKRPRDALENLYIHICNWNRLKISPK